jgi:hypothetical protein
LHFFTQDAIRSDMASWEHPSHNQPNYSVGTGRPGLREFIAATRNGPEN